MENEQKDKILGKIKKLMALGMKHEESPEGKSALAKAKKLMAEHDIRFIDVEEDGSISDDSTGRVDVPWHKRANDFEGHLANCIAGVLDCRYVITNSGTKWKAHAFIGTHSDMELATWLFKYTRLQSYRLAEKQPFTGKDLRTYFHGLSATLRMRIVDTFGTVESENLSEEQCTALIVVKKDAVDRKVSEIFPKLKKARKTRPLSGSRDAYQSGSKDGNKVSLNKQVA